MTRADRRTLVRQLRDEGLSQRKIAGRLKVSKDTVRRDLDEIERQDADADAPGDAPPAAPDDPLAPQVSVGDSPVSAPPVAPVAAPPAEPARAGEPGGASPMAHDAPPADLPRRVSAQRLEIDLRRSPGLRRDLAVLASTGMSVEEAIAQAVTVLAAGYRRGLAQRRIVPGPFVVRDVYVSPPMPARLVPRRPETAPPEGA
ncbi:DeoR family transcriptional regulator [Streptomyces sp. B21-105]|uniref:DeoR family transcriptional regulator n=1 Tax=Streptomyces sp. B21-105 TaxID=3039417 RepID=UPI002FEF9362